MEENKIQIPEYIPTNDLDVSGEMSPEDKAFNEELATKYEGRDDYEGSEVIAEEADVTIDEETGMYKIGEVGSGSDINTMSEEDSGDFLESIIKNEENINKNIESFTDTDKFNEELKNTYDLSDEEIISMMAMLSRLQKGEKFAVFPSLPKKLQTIILSAMASNSIPATNENKNLIAKDLVNDIIKDINNDQEFVEFNAALKELANIPSMMDFHAENCRETMEIKLSETAEKYKESNPKVAESLLAISEAWKETYIFKRINDLLDTSERARNRITKETMYYDKFIRDFNFKSEKSKFIINDLDQMTKSLLKVINGDDRYDSVPANTKLERCRGITLLFAKTCDGLNFNDPVDVAYIYYSIKNVISLDFLDGKILEFNEILLENIKTLYDRVSNIDEINKANSTRPMTKKEKRHGRS
jgi:hypothetical protein